MFRTEKWIHLGMVREISKKLSHPSVHTLFLCFSLSYLTTFAVIRAFNWFPTRTFMVHDRGQQSQIGKSEKTLDRKTNIWQKSVNFCCIWHEFTSVLFLILKSFLLVLPLKENLTETCILLVGLNIVEYSCYLMH